MSRIPGLAAGAGLAAALLLSAVGLPQAALTEGRAAPASGGRPLLLAQAPAAPAPNVEAFIADMHQRLAITPAQEPQFDAFANVLRQNAQIRPSPPSTNADAVEMLRLTIQAGQQMINGSKRLLAPLQSLYASLSPAQRQTFDAASRQGPGQ